MPVRQDMAHRPGIIESPPKHDEINNVLMNSNMK